MMATLMRSRNGMRCRLTVSPAARLVERNKMDDKIKLGEPDRVPEWARREAGLAATNSSARLSGNTLASILVRHGIIDLCAVEDAEGYDGGMTMARVRTVAQEITETIAPNV